MYSGIPLVQTSEMWTPHFNGHCAQVWIVFSLTTVHYIFISPETDGETSLFCKVDRFFGPSDTWTVPNSLYYADAHKPLTFPQ